MDLSLAVLEGYRALVFLETSEILTVFQKDYEEARIDTEKGETKEINGYLTKTKFKIFDIIFDRFCFSFCSVISGFFVLFLEDCKNLTSLSNSLSSVPSLNQQWTIPYSG